MQHFTAQLNDAGICIAVTVTSEPLDSPKCISIESYDESLMGKKFDSGAWLTVALTPNTPNNPYAGKASLPPDEFYALVGKTLTAARYKRLRNDAAFLWIQDMLQSPTFRAVDPDDKKGQFLQLVGLPDGQGYVTATAAEDGQALMTKAERDAIIAAWPNKV